MGLFSRGDKIDVDELPAVPMFVGLGDDEIKEIAKLAHRKEVPAGEKLIEQGRFGDHFYIVAEGHALVYIGGAFVTDIGEGSAVGEMALLEHRPRNATVIAETDMVVAEFGIREFNKMLDRYPTANLRVNELLNRRLNENLERG